MPFSTRFEANALFGLLFFLNDHTHVPLRSTATFFRLFTTNFAYLRHSFCSPRAAAAAYAETHLRPPTPPQIGRKIANLACNIVDGLAVSPPIFWTVSRVVDAILQAVLSCILSFLSHAPPFTWLFWSIYDVIRQVHTQINDIMLNDCFFNRNAEYGTILYRVLHDNFAQWKNYIWHVLSIKV